MSSNLLSIFDDIFVEIQRQETNSLAAKIVIDTNFFSKKFNNILIKNSSLRKQLVNTVNDLQSDIADFFTNCGKSDLSQKSKAISNELAKLHNDYRIIEGLETRANNNDNDDKKTENLQETFNRYLGLINNKLAELPKRPLNILEAFVNFLKTKMSDKLMETYDSNKKNTNSITKEYLDFIKINTKSCKDKENPVIDYVQENEKLCLGEKFYDQIKDIRGDKKKLNEFLIKQQEDSIPVAFEPRMPITVIELPINKCNPENKSLCNVFVQCKGNTSENVGITQQMASCDCDYLMESSTTEELYNTESIDNFSTKNKLALLCILDQTLGKIISKSEGIVEQVQFEPIPEKTKPIEFRQVKGQGI